MAYVALLAAMATELPPSISAFVEANVSRGAKDDGTLVASEPVVKKAIKSKAATRGAATAVRDTAQPSDVRSC